MNIWTRLKNSEIFYLHPSVLLIAILNINDLLPLTAPGWHYNWGVSWTIRFYFCLSVLFFQLSWVQHHWRCFLGLSHSCHVPRRVWRNFDTIRDSDALQRSSREKRDNRDYLSFCVRKTDINWAKQRLFKGLALTAVMYLFISFSTKAIWNFILASGVNQVSIWFNLMKESNPTFESYS